MKVNSRRNTSWNSIKGKMGKGENRLSLERYVEILKKATFTVIPWKAEDVTVNLSTGPR